MKKLDLNTDINCIKELENTYLFTNEQSSVIEVLENTTLTVIDVITKNIDVQRELVVAKNATLNYIKIGKSETGSTIKYTNTIKENATLNISIFEKSSSANVVDTILKSDDSKVFINGLVDLKENSKVVYTVNTVHQSKSLSDIAFINLLDDKSFARLDMFSIVENNAAFSKAFQNSKTILLSDDSSVAVTPHLEISIDELEASHGATCGDIDKESIYYLQSRGISEVNAKKMVLDALRYEVITKLDDEKLAKFIKGLL